MNVFDDVDLKRNARGAIVLSGYDFGKIKYMIQSRKFTKNELINLIVFAEGVNDFRDIVKTFKNYSVLELKEELIFFTLYRNILKAEFEVKHV